MACFAGLGRLGRGLGGLGGLGRLEGLGGLGGLGGRGDGAEVGASVLAVAVAPGGEEGLGEGLHVLGEAVVEALLGARDVVLVEGEAKLLGEGDDLTKVRRKRKGRGRKEK